MSNKEYIKFFNACLEHKMTIKKYIPVQEYLFRIMAFINTKPLIKNNEEVKVEFCKTILGAFTIIMNRKNFNYLDEYINFLETVNFEFTEYSSSLLTIVFGKNAFENPEFNVDYIYNAHMRKICKYAVNNRDKVMLLDGESRFINMMKIYAKYGMPLPEFGRRVTPTEIKSLDYYNIGYSIIEKLYLSDIDLQYLDTFLNDLSNDFIRMMSYLEFNDLLSTSRTSKNVKYLNNPLEFIVNYDPRKKLIR
jgi:hypothetical protein